MDNKQPPQYDIKDLNSLLPISGTVINVCGGDEGISETLKSMLYKKLLWTDEEYCPIGVPQRLLPSPLLSDENGLEIWRTIVKLPTYYQMSAEIELLEERGNELSRLVPPNAIMMDLGCGDVRKIKPLLDELESLNKDVWYFALDLSRESLERGMRMLLSLKYKHVRCYGLWGTFDDGLTWLNNQPFENSRFFMSLGSIFGNDHFSDAVNQLSTWRRQAFRSETDAMLLTMDATHDVVTLWESYHDLPGHFEQFIRNGYRHSNRVLGHEWYRDEDWEFRGVVQDEPLMHRFVIQSNKPIDCPPLRLHLPTGTEIDCYEAFKYSPDMMRREFAESGFAEIECWKAPRAQIYQYLLVSTRAQEL
ncbi:hypothetical protein GQX73_g3417 [Xylaria multiplex]|uniref:Histidine-specific methyltransferase SAM-dependent domain-containing protein n=1 Tax=Xylaria multiplex TaxID=323545 RepID=A0A7C8N793_9PEZI|nr:hypothetical protein GQX73_g3417 [Xylaria multiplex]